jgi:hypothetical protein
MCFFWEQGGRDEGGCPVPPSCNRFLLAVPLIQSSGYSFFYRCFGGINIPHTRTQYTHASVSSLPVPD